MLAAVALLLPAAARADAAGGASFIAERIQVQGSTLPLARLAAATRPFVGARLDRAGLQHVTDALSALYAGSDIALYAVTVPEQNFAQGALRIAAYEGFVERMDLHGDLNGDLALVKSYGGRIAAERPLKKSTLQRYAALLRGIPGVAVELQLLAGSRPGAARLSIGIKRNGAAFAVALDNRGTAELGRVQVQAEADFYGVLRDGDLTRLTIAVPADAARFRFAAVSLSEPLDDDGTQADAAISYLRTHPAGASLTGGAQALHLAVAHAFVRDAGHELTGSAGFDALDASSALIGAILSTERVRALRVAATYAVRGPDRLASLSVSAGLGIAGLGARIAGGFAGDAAFRKLALQASLIRRLGDAFTLRLRGIAQYGANRLPSSELVVFGGATVGSAFETASVFGDSGAGARAELGYRGLPATGPLHDLEPYAFADGGEAWLRARPFLAARRFGLASAGLGVRLAIGARGTFELEAARGLAAPVPSPHEGNWRLSFALHAKTD